MLKLICLVRDSVRAWCCLQKPYTTGMLWTSLEGCIPSVFLEEMPRPGWAMKVAKLSQFLLDGVQPRFLCFAEMGRGQFRIVQDRFKFSSGRRVLAIRCET